LPDAAGAVLAVMHRDARPMRGHGSSVLAQICGGLGFDSVIEKFMKARPAVVPGAAARVRANPELHRCEGSETTRAFKFT